MSNDKFISEMSQQFGKDGIRFLFLFKTMKMKVIQELQKEKRKLPNEAILNDVCAKAALELLIKSEKTPSEARISEALQTLKEKFNQRIV
jgi:hypothetical protein